MSRRSAEMATALVVLAATWWTTLPEHRRNEYRMRLARSTATAAHRIARRIGRWAMREELLGNRTAADDLYQSAYRIMTGPYRGASGLYEKMRGSVR